MKRLIEVEIVDPKDFHLGPTLVGFGDFEIRNPKQIKRLRPHILVYKRMGKTIIVLWMYADKHIMNQLDELGVPYRVW